MAQRGTRLGHEDRAFVFPQPLPCASGSKDGDESMSKASTAQALQRGAPKIAKLVCNYNNCGLW